MIEDKTIDEIMQGWIKEFDTIYSKQNQSGYGIKFIEVEGEMLSIEEFLKYKLTQTNQ